MEQRNHTRALIIFNRYFPRSSRHVHYDHCTFSFAPSRRVWAALPRTAFYETSYLRGESSVNFGPKVVRVEYEHADHKGEEHHDEEDHELEDVLHGPAERDLQGAEALVRGEDVGDPGEAEHDRNGVEAFGDDLRV